MSENKIYVSYLRVSTEEQGRSGLGLEAQRQAVADFINDNGSRIVEEFRETESGRNNARPELECAISTARLHGARLVVAKLDRLARDASFMLSLQRTGVDFVAADMPDANRLTVGILAMVAEQEARDISERTKKALAQSNKSLGGHPERLSIKARRKGGRVSARVRGARADQRALDLRRIIAQVREEGATSLRELAEGLNERKIPTARDSTWTATAVKRVLDRLQRLEVEQG